MRYGYKASAEQFGPRELLEYSQLAERLGLDSIALSDHFQPWRHHGGHAPAALPWLGAAGGGDRTSARIGTSVLTPDAALPARGDRAGVRDARLPVPRPRVARASAPARR